MNADLFIYAVLCLLLLIMFIKTALDGFRARRTGPESLAAMPPAPRVSEIPEARRLSLIGVWVQAGAGFFQTLSSNFWFGVAFRISVCVVATVLVVVHLGWAFALAGILLLLIIILVILAKRRVMLVKWWMAFGFLSWILSLPTLGSLLVDLPLKLVTTTSGANYAYSPSFSSKLGAVERYFPFLFLFVAGAVLADLCGGVRFTSKTAKKMIIWPICMLLVGFGIADSWFWFFAEDFPGRIVTRASSLDGRYEVIVTRADREQPPYIYELFVQTRSRWGMISLHVGTKIEEDPMDNEKVEWLKDPQRIRFIESGEKYEHTFTSEELAQLGYPPEHRRPLPTKQWVILQINQVSQRGDMSHADACHESLSYYDDLAKLDPSDPVTFFGRGLCKIDIHDHMGAITDLSTAIKLDGKNGQYYYERGVAWSELNEGYRACVDFSTARQLGYVSYRNEDLTEGSPGSACIPTSRRPGIK